MSVCRQCHQPISISPAHHGAWITTGPVCPADDGGPHRPHIRPAAFAHTDADTINTQHPTYLGGAVTVTSFNPVSGHCICEQTSRRGRTISIGLHLSQLVLA